MAAGDDAGQPVSQEGEAVTRGKKRKRKGQSQYKKCSRPKVHRKNIIFQLKTSFQISKNWILKNIYLSNHPVKIQVSLVKKADVNGSVGPWPTTYLM